MGAEELVNDILDAYPRQGKPRGARGRMGMHPAWPDEKGRFYDWARTFSYNADITMVITARGRGKTYGLRKACVDDFLARGYRFVEVVRYKAELSEIMGGYFDKLAMHPDFDGVEFRTEGRKGLCRRTGDKKWDVLCYFVSLSEAQNAKKRTYVNVRRIIFDEALIEPGTYLRYLPREYQTLTNVVDTVTREVAGTARVRPHLYLLSNACDLVNPLFIQWGIDRVPPFGYSWHAGHTVLLHYEDPGDFGAQKATETLAGRMAASTDEGETALQNLFNFGTDDDVHKKPPEARFWLGLVYRRQTFGVWVDYNEGYYYVTRKIPEGAGTVYSLTRADNSANRLIARRATPAMQAILEAHYDRIIRYESIGLREELLNALSMFGVR